MSVTYAPGVAGGIVQSVPKWDSTSGAAPTAQQALEAGFATPALEESYYSPSNGLAGSTPISGFFDSNSMPVDQSTPGAIPYNGGTAGVAGSGILPVPASSGPSPTPVVVPTPNAPGTSAGPTPNASSADPFQAVLSLIPTLLAAGNSGGGGSGTPIGNVPGTQTPISALGALQPIGTPTSSSSSGSIVVIVAVIALIGLGVFLYMKHKKKKGPPIGAPPVAPRQVPA